MEIFAISLSLFTCSSFQFTPNLADIEYNFLCSSNDSHFQEIQRQFSKLNEGQGQIQKVDTEFTDD